MTFEFKSYPKIPRLGKLRWSITEKLDGTNGIIHIVSVLDGNVIDALGAGAVAVVHGGEGIELAVFAGSRSRWLNPGVKGGDNYGFGQWVKDNADELVALLGEGTHYGEWWGQGIQRNYGLVYRQFTLFNPWRYPHLHEVDACVPGGKRPLLTVVPILSSGDCVNSLAHAVNSWTKNFQGAGSYAAPGFKDPEGFVVCIGDKLHKVITSEGDKSKSRDEPDKYCVRQADGNCISDDPRCMHQGRGPL